VRLALVLIALLTLTGQARADVFVPADPPPLPGARCVTAGADVVAAEAGNALVVSVAGGPWQPIAGLSGCPAVAAASDGTAAIVASASDLGGSAIVIRPPGGAFGARVPLGVSSEGPSVAVAPGGWAVVSSPSSGDDNGLTAIVVRPDGTTARAVLDRVGTRQFFGRSEVAIDASGNATIVWARSTGRQVRIRTAQAIAGGPPVAGADLPGTFPEEEAFAVSVTPSGHRLLTWTTTNGLLATVDGQAPQTVDATTPVSRLAASLADDGAAAIVYSSASREIVAVDRTAGGAWAIPHVLAPPAGRRSDDDGSYSTSDDPPAPLVTIGPGSQAVATWAARRGDVVGVVAAAGQAGGVWAPATALSSITRDAYPAGIARFAAGPPRVFWLESDRGVFGAVLAPAATDTTPPSVTAAFPRRVAPTRTGRIVVTVRVRCSEACDAKLN
jgi:hypothetical protein